MKKDDGLDLLIAHLDKVFEKDKNDNAYEKYIIFEDIRRNPGEDIGEFMIRFDRAMKQAKAIEIVYPDNVLAFKLMRSMNLSADEQKMIYIQRGKSAPVNRALHMPHSAHALGLRSKYW